MTALIYAICGVVGFVVTMSLLVPLLHRPPTMTEEQAAADELIESLRRANPAP